MNPVGLGFLDRPRVAEQVRLAQKAEALGYDSMHRDPEKARFDAKRLVTRYLGQQPHFAKALDYPADGLAATQAVMGGSRPVRAGSRRRPVS